MDKDLINRIKEECMGLFIEGNSDYNPSFGYYDMNISHLSYLTSLDNNYSRWSRTYFRLPKPMKTFITNAHAMDKLGLENLYIFHYPLDLQTVIKNTKVLLDNAK